MILPETDNCPSHGKCLRRFFKRKSVGAKASRSAYDKLYPQILKLYPLKNSHFGKLQRENLILLLCHAHTICTDLHC